MKPRNFCIAYLPDKRSLQPAVQQQQRQQQHQQQRIYIIDLEGTQAIPDAAQAGWDAQFFGTADYSGANALLSCTAGPCDDLESLCYRHALPCMHDPRPACMLLVFKKCRLTTAAH